MSKELSTKEIRDLILTVVAYADLFDYPLTIDEIRRDIPENNISVSRLASVITTTNGLTDILKNKKGMFYLKDREHLVNLRRQRNHSTELLFEEHREKIDTICRIPWVRAVALSGSVAFNNAKRDDDIDLFVIVKANRLWLVDLYNLFVIRIWREKILRKSKSICVNYVVDEAGIALRERDFFSSHQVVHMIPIYDEGVWKYFVDANKWAFDFFPAAIERSVRIAKAQPAKKKIERVFDFLGAGLLNTLIYSLRAKRLKKLRRNGIIKGEYEFRRLKTNDSRFGSIVHKHLVDKILEVSNHPYNLNGLMDKSKIINDENGIMDCIPPENRLSIEGFLEYYKSKIPENEKRSDGEIISLPYQKKEHGRNDVWRIRERNYNLVMGQIRRLEPDGNGPVLDLGAGNCWLSRRLIETGYDCVSLDPLESAESGLRGGDIFEREIGIKLTRVLSTMETMPFINSVFNGVVSSGSFHYTNCASMVLKEIHRILKPDGWAIIYDSPVFGDSESGDEMVEEKKLEFGDGDVLDNLAYKPIWFIVLDEFIKLAKEIGFEIEVIQTRSPVARLLDGAKNKVQSKRKWAEFPILLLRKTDSQKKDKTGFLQKLRYIHYRQFVEPSLIPSKIIQLDGISFRITQGVFHPGPYDSSRILLKLIRKRFGDLSNKNILDIGTGSGIHAIAAAKLNARVVAVDINPDAVRCAQENALFNEVGERIEFFHSDLFDDITHKKFDLIFFNPPFYDRQSKSPSEKAWYDSHHQTLIRFLENLSSYLMQDGEALVILSNRADVNLFEKSCGENNLSFAIVKRKRVWDEVYRVYSIKARRGQ